jgi:hypothetical protein
MSRFEAMLHNREPRQYNAIINWKRDKPRVKEETT